MRLRFGLLDDVIELVMGDRQPLLDVPERSSCRPEAGVAVSPPMAHTGYSCGMVMTGDPIFGFARMRKHSGAY